MVPEITQKPYYQTRKTTCSLGEAWVGVQGRAGFRKYFSKSLTIHQITLKIYNNKKKDHNYSLIIRPKRRDLAYVCCSESVFTVSRKFELFGLGKQLKT